MSLVDSAREHFKQVAETVVEKVKNAATTDSRVQAVTIARPRPEVLAFFQDPNQLSEVFGDVADVTSTGPDRLRWKFVLDGSNGPEWECIVVAENETRLRFVDVNPNVHAGIVLEFCDAPQGRGTEVIAKASSPAPGTLTGALTFKALYRARALQMTGELPTIKHNPGFRDSER